MRRQSEQKDDSRSTHDQNFKDQARRGDRIAVMYK